MELKLVFPSTEHAHLWADIIDEFKENIEDIVPFALEFSCDNYELYLKKTNNYHNDIDVLPHLVSASTYFLMEDDTKILGAVNIRHKLNDYLLKTGGHIGYGIRPSERKKGYATTMLSLALEKCKELGITDALVTCNRDNIGSEKVIVKNGGVYENTVIENSTNSLVKRYWIKVK